MIFRKKRQEEYVHNLEEIKQQAALQAEKLLDDRIDNVLEIIRTQSERMDRQMESLSERTEGIQKIQKRQLQSLEDFLEEEQERTDTGEVLRQRLKEREERESHLLFLAGCYQEQMHLLRQQLQKEFQGDEYKAALWEKQFEIVDECLKKQMHICALEQTGKEREPVDLDCHQVLKVIHTDEEKLDSKVAEVFSPGYIYHGKVMKKAQISAYRRTKDGDSNRN